MSAARTQRRTSKPDPRPSAGSAIALHRVAILKESRLFKSTKRPARSAAPSAAGFFALDIGSRNEHVTGSRASVSMAKPGQGRWLLLFGATTVTHTTVRPVGSARALALVVGPKRSPQLLPRPGILFTEHAIPRFAPNCFCAVKGPALAFWIIRQGRAFHCQSSQTSRSRGQEAASTIAAPGAVAEANGSIPGRLAAGRF